MCLFGAIKEYSGVIQMKWFYLNALAFLQYILPSDRVYKEPQSDIFQSESVACIGFP